MTLLASERGAAPTRVGGHCMPVIRYPNFSDKTCDLPPEKFFLLVGNEKKTPTPLTRVTLAEYLSNFRNYLTNESSWSGKATSLFDAKRDTHVLVSPQACFLPVPALGKTNFTPTIFNYQSHHRSPASLAILCTREGTSATILGRDGDRNRLWFNAGGQRAMLNAERKAEFVATQKAEIAKLASAEEKAKAERTLTAEIPSLNLVLVVHVPLKQPRLRSRSRSRDRGDRLRRSRSRSAGRDRDRDRRDRRDRADIDEAVIGHGEANQGPFLECDGLPLERDSQFPIRVTVQFYQATSNGVVEEVHARTIAAQLNRVFAEADYVGSLVCDGPVGRPTEAKIGT